jgi:predicted RNA-binding protein Jag
MTTSVSSHVPTGAAPAPRTSVRTRISRERAAELWLQADAAADEAERSGTVIPLPAMTACERRVVHDRLLARPGVRAHAEGEDPERYLVVAPV